MQCNSLIFTCSWSRTKQTTHQYHKAFCCVVYIYVCVPSSYSISPIHICVADRMLDALVHCLCDARLMRVRLEATPANKRPIGMTQQESGMKGCARRSSPADRLHPRLGLERNETKIQLYPCACVHGCVNVCVCVLLA